MTGRKRVLIVDDEPDLVAMLAMRLDATGLFDISTARDGTEGLERAAALQPDVILLDNVMPVMGGWEVCRRLRADPACEATSIVMMTAGSPQESQNKAREFRADALILKPFDQQGLIDTLKSVARAQEASCLSKPSRLSSS